jgi:hypothetical protein
MAHLNSKATDGTLSFVKYVTNNPRWKEIDFEIEKGSSTPLYKKVNRTSYQPTGKTVYSAGTKIKFISNKHAEVGTGRTVQRWANVDIKGKKGWILLKDIRKPTSGNGTQYEDQVVDAINDYIVEAGGTVDFRLKGDRKTYKGISYAIKVDTPLKNRAGVRGDPKADIILCKDKSDPLAAGSIYISHKKQGGPEAFQQYGGLSPQAGEFIYKHILTQKFLKHVATLIGNSSKLPRPVMATFKNDELMNKSIYGPDYGSNFSINHTQLIGQGNPTFRTMRSWVQLDFSSHMSLSGDLSHFVGGYLPVFGATYRAGRGFNYDGNRYRGARVAIYPKKLMETRSGVEVINLTMR